MVPNTFSQFLLKNAYATLEELEEASQATVLFGGRLGTALIELGILTPEQVDVALARHHGLPEIPREWLERPDAGARAALHVDFSKRHRAFPLFFEKRSLHVGLVDPRDELVVDNLAFASGCLIVPYALAEFRFAELMHRIYAVAPSARFRTLLDERNLARARRERAAQRTRSATSPASPPAIQNEPLAPDLDAAERDAFFLVNTVAAPLRNALAPEATVPAPAQATEPARLPAHTSSQPASEPDTDPITLDRRAPQASLEDLERTIAESEDRAQVIEAALGLASRFAAVAALFVIRDGVATGLAAQRSGEALDVDATSIPLTADSVLARCHASRAPQRGLPASAVDDRLAKALRSDESTELVAFPVAIKERVVNLLVARPARGGMSATGIAALAAIAPQIAGAYERMIRIQKQKAQGAGAPSQREPASGKAAIGALPLRKRIVRVPARD